MTRHKDKFIYFNQKLSLNENSLVCVITNAKEFSFNPFGVAHLATNLMAGIHFDY